MVHDPRDLDETIPPEARGPCPAEPGEPPIPDTMTFQQPPPAQEECPRQIGRYQVESVLGKGGFGVHTNRVWCIETSSPETS
ncbi:MAG: hypothetical protein NTY19_18180 [Planctomycetota bacterium]|nr:hypothetical protein [Planctomycetota bacterium]